MNEVFLYDLDDEEIINLVIESGYCPISTNKENRKLNLFRKYLNEKGIICRDYDLEVFQRSGFFRNTLWIFRIYNPKVTSDDDDLYKEVIILDV